MGSVECTYIEGRIPFDMNTDPGSIMSLTAGLVFGGAAAFGAMQTSKNPANYMIILGTSFALSCLMGYRYANSGKFMPAGLVAALSLMMVIRYGSRMYSA